MGSIFSGTPCIGIFSTVKQRLRRSRKNVLRYSKAVGQYENNELIQQSKKKTNRYIKKTLT